MKAKFLSVVGNICSFQQNWGEHHQQKCLFRCLWSRAFSNTLNPSMHTDLSERYSRLWHADYKKTGSTCLVCSLGKSFTTVTLCMVKRTLTVWRNAISFKTTNCVLSSSLSRSLPPKCTTRNSVYDAGPLPRMTLNVEDLLQFHHWAQKQGEVLLY